MAGGEMEPMGERNDDFNVNDPKTWLKEVEMGDGVKVNVPVMLLVAKEENAL
jgi:hypothetical protein